MKTLLASLIATIAFSTFGTSADAQSAPSAASAQTPSLASADLTIPQRSHPGRQIEGLWDEHVTLINCTSGAPLVTFRATNLFVADGSLIAVNNNPPSSAGPTLGTWWRVSRHGDYAAKMRFFRYNPDGSFAGAQQVTRWMEVDSGGDTLTGTVSVEIFDVNDNLIQTACATEEGARVS